MTKTLAILVLAVIVLGWKFIFSPGEKIEFTDQAKVLQGLSNAIGYKIAVRNYWIEKKEFPSAEEWSGQDKKPAPDLSKSIVNAIEVGEDGPGVISVHYTDKPGVKIPAEINGEKIMLIPYIQDDKLNWHCKGTMPARFMPKKCRVVSEKD